MKQAKTTQPSDNASSSTQANASTTKEQNMGQIDASPIADPEEWDYADVYVEVKNTSEFHYPFPITVPVNWDSHLDFRYYLENFFPLGRSPYYDVSNRIQRNFERFDELVDGALRYFGEREEITRLKPKLQRLAEHVELDQPESQYSLEMAVFIAIYQDIVDEYWRLYFAMREEKEWTFYEVMQLGEWLKRAWERLREDLLKQYKDLDLPDC